MKKPPDKAPLKTLRDAYKVPGFHVRLRLDSYEFEHPAVVLTLDRRSKKLCAAGAGGRAAAVTINAGGGCAIWGAATARSISILRCIACSVRLAA
jgi:hypothetical protein